VSNGSHRPFRGLFDMFAELSRMREHWTQVEPGAEGRTHAGAWVPAVDIYARDRDLVIRCELAGIPKGDLEVSLCRGQLWISGERTGAPEGEGEPSYYVRERRYGPFRRTINLPEGIEAGRLEATMEDGLLEIVIRGGAEDDAHEEIEIAGAEGRAVRLDVAGET
jgi:HSP20 family protein